MRLILLSIMLIASPFWPFGAELLPGDPLIIINKQTNELAWINHGQIVMQTKVATGKTTDLTPEGLFTIKVKAKDPYYRKKNIVGEIRTIRLDRGGLVLMQKAPMAGYTVCMVQTSRIP